MPQQRQWQAAVPAAPPRPPRFHLWAPPERADVMASTSVIGTVMRFTRAFGPAGSHSSSRRKAGGAVHTGGSLAPALPLPTPGKTSVSPGIACTAAFGWLYTSLQGSPPLTVEPCSCFIAGLFFEARWTPADGKPGTKGRTGCSGASNRRGDAECASSATLTWHRPNSRGLAPCVKQTALETESEPRQRSKAVRSFRQTDRTLCLCRGMHRHSCVANVAVVAGANVQHHYMNYAFLHM